MDCHRRGDLRLMDKRFLKLYEEKFRSISN